MFRKQNLAAISHPSLLTACQMALAVTLGLLLLLIIRITKLWSKEDSYG
jgi:hypothetical protein